MFNLRKTRRTLRKLFRKACEPVEQPIVDLASGIPNYKPPREVLDAVSKAFNMDSCYTSPRGLLDLREKLSEKIEDEHGIYYDPDNEVLITHGASEALYSVLVVMLKDSRKILVPTPHYPFYKHQILSLGGKLLTYPFGTNIPFSKSLAYIEKHMSSSRDKYAILINSPHNPTGKVLSRKEVEELSEFIEERDVIVIWDEVYEKIIFDGEHYTLANIQESRSKVVFINSFSKTYAMHGWRIGFIYGPSRIIDEVFKIHKAITLGLNPIPQLAALAALNTNKKYIENILNILRKRRNAILSRLKRMEAFDLAEGQGTFFLFPKLKLPGMSSEEFVKVLQNNGVKVLPGKAFNEEGYVRISFAHAGLDEIEQALGRIENVVTKIIKSRQ